MKNVRIVRSYNNDITDQKLDKYYSFTLFIFYLTKLPMSQISQCQVVLLLVNSVLWVM
jgi:hypothetical protein